MTSHELSICLNTYSVHHRGSVGTIIDACWYHGLDKLHAWILIYTVHTKNYRNILERRRFGLVMFRLVNVSVCQRFGCRRFDLSMF